VVAAAATPVVEATPSQMIQATATTAEAANPGPPAATAPKTRWGDLANAAPKDPQPPVKVEPTKATLASTIVKRFRPGPVEKVERVDSSNAACSYDAKLLRIKDFRLPGLDGKPVRFQDLDADYVLLDFWGTWCAPCIESIPHLIELQKRYGPSKLKVIGIACEEAPIDQRKAKVEEFARKFGINYTVLMSSMDGKPCPMQQALAIQAMPTMILLDRKGQILWRSTGSTPANESRLDRVLASQMSWSETARR
jgi:thiol-disulfide isomerase/thioredoxin